MGISLYPTGTSHIGQKKSCTIRIGRFLGCKGQEKRAKKGEEKAHRAVRWGEDCNAVTHKGAVSHFLWEKQSPTSWDLRTCRATSPPMQDCQNREKSREPAEVLKRALDCHRSNKLDSIKFNYTCEMQETQVTSGLDDPGEDNVGIPTNVWSRNMDDERKSLLIRLIK